MYRIINSLAKAEYNKRISAVEVHFSGHGDAYQYQESLDIAANIALMYDVQRWFFQKKQFSDISEQQFVAQIQAWYLRFSEYFMDHSDTCCTVVLLTSVASQAVMKDLPALLSNDLSKKLAIKVFTTRDEVHEFLIGESDKMLSM